MSTRSVQLLDHSPHPFPGLGQLVQKAAIAVSQHINQLGCPRYRPIIVKGCDRHGQSYWEVYDPNTQRTLYCMNEAEVQQWLDSMA